MMFIQGISIIRNVIAVAATFAAIFGLMATILQYGLKLATRNKTITTRQEAAILIIAVLTALGLIPIPRFVLGAVQFNHRLLKIFRSLYLE